MDNTLYYGDNLPVLREHFADESVDLICLDPPFNSNATYNLLFKERSGEQSVAQITAFEDTWHWGWESETAYGEIVKDGPGALSSLLQAMLEFLGRNDMMAYLVMMSQRMIELRRVLKQTGSIYLHCDPTASHYLKLLMDAAFGGENFLNEIIWYYRGAGIPKGARARRHDVLLWYAKDAGHHYFNPDPIRRPYAEATTKRFAHYIGNIHGDRDYEPERLNPIGKHPDDVITHIQPIAPSAKERLGYPTQKPELLLENLIVSASKEGDIVLDPFCGCGTAVAVAESLNRRWMGIDITHLAISTMKNRLHDTFMGELSNYEIIGVPKDLESAKALATESEHDGRYQFEWWALGLVGALPARDKRKGADSGIDGRIDFFDDNSKAKRIIVQVKSGNVGVSQIRDLKGVMARENAQIGLFVTLKNPTRPMLHEAVSAGVYVPEQYPNLQFPRIQILTIEELLGGSEPQYPRFAPEATYRRSPRRRRSEGHQANLEDASA